MKFFGYYVSGKNYGCTESAKKKAERAAAEQEKPIVRKSYKI